MYMCWIGFLATGLESALRRNIYLEIVFPVTFKQKYIPFFTLTFKYK